MGQFSKIAAGSFTSTGVAKFISLPFAPVQFEIINKTKWDTATSNLVRTAIGFAEDTAGTAYAICADGAAATDKNVTLTSGGFSFISAGSYSYGPTLTISGITKAAAAVVTTSTNHNLSTGDTVLIYGTTAMLQVSGVFYTITKTGATTFTIPVDSSGFANAATAGFCKQVLYVDLYTPYSCGITSVATGATTVITTAANHTFQVGQEVFFTLPSAWGMIQLDSLGVRTATGIPQQAYVTAVTANTLTVNINSTAFTAFAYPTSAAFALGAGLPQVSPIGDQNSGLSGSSAIPPLASVPPAITIPGAWSANTRQGVIVGIGNGTQIMHQTSDVVRWIARYPDVIL